MNFKFRMRLVTTLFILGSLAIPAAAQAYGNCSGKGGKVYNENDGTYYSVPNTCKKMVYRSVDGHYIPVASYGRSCCNMKRSYSKVDVQCQTRPAHWWGTTWMGRSQECWYVVR